MVTRHTEDTISIPPTMSGDFGRAWLVDLDAAAARLPFDQATSGDATLASWLIEAPNAHPFWHSYWLALIHLRPDPGDVPPKLYLPDATHELWLYALDPDKPRQEMIESGLMRVLQPGNFAGQMRYADDAEAFAAAKVAVRKVCDGRLSPDTDFRAQWVALFGDWMIKK